MTYLWNSAAVQHLIEDKFRVFDEDCACRLVFSLFNLSLACLMNPAKAC